MISVRFIRAAAFVAATLVSSAALAQMSPSANTRAKPDHVRHETTGQASQPSTTQKVENWTKKEWNSAKAKWSKNKAAWRSCNAQAKKQRLTGRKSWSFIYDCMTKS